MDTSNVDKWEDEQSLEEMEDEVESTTCEAIFREIAQSWLKENGLRILLEESTVHKPKPKYRRQNASNCFGQK